MYFYCFSNQKVITSTMNASFVPMTLFLFHYQLLVYFQIPSAVPGFILVMITSTEGGLWVNPTIGLMSKSLGSLVVVKVYLCMRDAKNRNNSVNAKDFPRQSLLPGKNSNILLYFFLNEWSLKILTSISIHGNTYLFQKEC